MTRLPTSASAAISSLLTIPPASPLTFIYASHSRWPLLPTASTGPSKSLKISVLDSSFNPPHAAHVALASLGSEDAQLLAFTLSNADKKVDKSELYHRLEMIRALAVDMGRKGDSGKWSNCAVAVLDAPFFTQKSEVLNDEVTKLVRDHGEKDMEPEFVFPVGWDTVIRIFASRYYPPPGPDLSSQMTTFFSTNRSSILCARRGNLSSAEETDFLSTPEVDKWIKQGKLEIFDLDPEVQGISSTEIRKAVKEEDWEKLERMVPFPSVVDIIRSEKLYKREC